MTARPRWVFALALLLAAPGAEAASFDCKKATRPEEKLVCSDPELSRLDEALAKAYLAGRQKLGVAAGESVQVAQRSWLGWWPRACSTGRKGVKLGRDAVACARREYEERLKAVQVTTGLDGRFTVYGVASYTLLPAAPEASGVLFAQHAWVHPRIDLAGLSGADVDLAGKVNAWLTPVPASVEETMKDRESTTSTSTVLGKVTPNILGAFTTTEFYAFGAAHPMDGSGAAYFNVARLRPLTAGDVFTGTQWVTVLADGALAQLRAALDDGLLVEKAADLHEMVKRPGSWIFKPQGLELDFGVDEVAPYAAGPQSATIPWASLRAFLTDFGRAEVASLK